MNYERFLKDKLIKKQKPDFKQIAYQLKRSLKDLKAGEANLKIDLTWSFTIAYHAMIRAGRVLMYSKGYLPTVKNSHKTIIDFTKLILGNEYQNLTNRFNRMRKRRHDFIYDSKNNITYKEAKASLDAAKSLISKIEDLIKEESPQKELF
ncbi:MAG: hypothetical protein Q8N27_06715 [Candidatus Hydromicrobium sp.]|nr:hypothetical protein [Candidatus Hydromicrobium sp.]